MEDKNKNEKFVCSICHEILLKNPNISGKKYAVRKASPTICDCCSQNLAELADDNQTNFDSKRNHRTNKKPTAVKANEVKPQAQSIKTIEKIKLMDIITNVKSVIKGQDEHVKTISTAIYKNQDLESVEIKSNLILLGDSGCGKTEIIKMLANEFNVPYVIEDATRFSEAGYFGASTDDMIRNLYRTSGYSISKAEKGILIIDEGDKKQASSDSGRDVSGENVLFSLLKMLEGSRVPIVDDHGDTMCYMDTSRLTIIFIGAFPNLVKIRDKRINCAGSVGFRNPGNTDTNINKEYIAADFINGGFPKEFVGRFDMIIELNKLTTGNLEDIIANSKKSTFMKYIEEFEKRGLKVSYSEDIISEIAIETEKLKTGARGIKNVVQNIFKNILFQILADDIKYTECIINKNIIYDPTDYILT
jgi:ATP-dependent Clp protease ATP-binding subunit ClpX